MPAACGAGRQQPRIECRRYASGRGNFRWTPVTDPQPVIPSHELRRGGNRPGPAHVWQSYDMAVERLAIHVQGNVISFVAHEFREIGWVLNEIADALEISMSAWCGDMLRGWRRPAGWVGCRGYGVRGQSSG
jgi:hypothetical protein